MKFVGKNVRAFHLYLLCYALFLMKYMNYKEWNINHSFDFFFLKSLRGGVDIKWGEISKFILPLKFWTFLHAFQKSLFHCLSKTSTTTTAATVISRHSPPLSRSLIFREFFSILLVYFLLLLLHFVVFSLCSFRLWKMKENIFFFMEKTNCFLVPLPLPLSLFLSFMLCVRTSFNCLRFF